MATERFTSSVAAIVAVMLISLPMWAAITGSISGVVHDPAGAVVPKAQVVATEVNTGVRHAVDTGPQGEYSFLALPVGRYTLQVTAPGFREYQQSDIVVNANDALRFDVSLELGQTSESVKVEATAVQVETQNTHVGDVITTRTVETLPLNGRSYTDLLGLQAGVVPVSTGAVGSSGGGNLSMAGQRETANGFEINGGLVEEARNNGAGVVPNLDAIGEFRVITSNADAEYGQFAGGIVNVVTKAGTNQFHGSAFEFVRNEKLDARNFYDVNQTDPVTGQEIPDTARGKFRRNQFGGTIGGPILKDKLFFFGDYQGTRETRGQSSGLVPVPTVAQKNGDFSADPAGTFTNTVGGGLASPYFASVLSQRLGYTVTSGEPYWTPGCNSSAQCVFPGGIIPQAAFSSAAKGMLKFIPDPNVINSQGAFFASSANDLRTDDDRWGTRVDYNSRIGMISGYYFWLRSNQLKPYGDNPVPGFPTQNANDTWNINIGDIKTFGPTAVNEFRVTLMRFVDKSDYPTQGLGINLADYGFQKGVPGGFIPADPAAEGIPAIGITGGPSFGQPGVVYNRYETIPHVRDGFSKVIGPHTLKVGADWSYVNFVQKFPLVGGNGFISFAGTETGNGFADYLLGAVDTFIQESALNFNERKHYFGTYAQGSWRVTPSLTVNYGVRWDYVQPWYERFNHRVTYVPGVQSTIFPTAPMGDLFPGDSVPGFGTIPPTTYRTPLNNFAPRVGVAYSPHASDGAMGWLVGQGKTSIRAAWGRYYSTIEGATTYNSDPEPPYLVFYVSPVHPFLELPLKNRTDGGVNPIPLPFKAPPPGSNVDFTPYLPLSGEPGFWIYNQTPYADHWNFDIQRQYGSNTLVTLGYVGSRGRNLLATQAVNPGDPQLCLSLPGCGPGGEMGTYTAADGSTVVTTRKPMGWPFGDLPLIKTIGKSDYHSFVASVRHQSGPLYLMAAYTFGKSLDNISSYNGETLNPFNPDITRSLSAFDVTHNFVISYDYLLPFDKFNGPRRLMGGWRLVGVTRFATGLPVGLIETDDRSLLGTGGAGIGSPIDEPNYTPGNLKFQAPREGVPYFNTSLFTLEPLGVLGTASRRFFHGPGINNFDLALLKDLKITERVQLQFRGEFFNVFNHAQFYNPNGNINSGTFGLVTQARDPRIGQLGVKILF